MEQNGIKQWNKWKLNKTKYRLEQLFEKYYNARHGCGYAVRSALCGMSRTNRLLARRHASLSLSSAFKWGIPMSIIILHSVKKREHS